MKVHFRYLHTIRAVDPYSIGILDRRSVRNARRSRERVLILTLLEY